uniref:CKK domain-containing protein n=1 Tax=Ascaris lumbricoides TaxID=6252 RepID=A0A0M3IL98_ASCLU
MLSSPSRCLKTTYPSLQTDASESTSSAKRTSLSLKGHISRRQSRYSSSPETFQLNGGSAVGVRVRMERHGGQTSRDPRCAKSLSNYQSNSRIPDYSKTQTGRRLSGGGGHMRSDEGRVLIGRHTQS